MSTYVLFGRYSPEALKAASPRRTEDCAAFIKSLGGEIQGGYSLLGQTDLLLIVDLPDNERAMRASSGLTKLTGIGFTTAPAVTLKEFDRLITQS
jgi:uncharacterized protein with GYD domain